MIYNGREVPFPAQMQVSFFKQIEILEEQAKSKDEITAEYAKSLLGEVEKFPELKEGISDLSKLNNYKKLIDLLCRPLFPEALSTNEIKIVTPPFYFDPLYSSKRFDDIIKASGKPFSFTMKDVDDDLFYLYCCYFILIRYYGYPVGGSAPQLFEIENKIQGISRTYKVLINADLAEFTPKANAVDITADDYEELMDNFGDMELWKRKFPPNSWIMRGVNIINMVDVTPDQAISSVTSSLLVYDPSAFEKIKSSIRNLLNDNSIHVGVINFENGRLETLMDEKIDSLLLQSGHELRCETDMCGHLHQTLIEAKLPLVFTDTNKLNFADQSDFSEKLKKSGFRSYIIAPAVHEGELLGFLEIGSKNKFSLHRGTLNILNRVLPILSMAKKRFQTESQNTIEAIIQQECTPIHPSVKWRFENEAQDFMKKQMNGDDPVFRDIVFEQLYPLYGQMDIKGSSERRNKAVEKDLSKQLRAVLKIIEKANELKDMPVYHEYIFRLREFLREIENDIAAGSEHKILSFLKSELYPVLDYLKSNEPNIQERVEKYYDMLDSEVHSVYEERKKYDTSVNLVNKHLANFIDKKQLEAQKMFPHYFERYKTDGIEFNMYIGESITENTPFDIIFLRNLRLWQLLIMCDMENEFRSIRQNLDTPLEVASLILVYSTPISVHFRMDEKKFDVEGAYNARYEIIKKRVDKAHIRNTTERITRPGSIVIVYSQDQDANEYKTYLKFLISKGFLVDDIEDHRLEDLEGVHGLRALRIAINYTSGNLSVDEFIREIEKTEMN